MRHCPSCGGVIGQDCFNPEECAWIGEQQERQAQHDIEHHTNEMEHLRADCAALVKALEGLLSAGDAMEHVSDYLPGDKQRRLLAAEQAARAALSAVWNQ